MKRKYTVVGIMSGTSLDGLDLVLCRIEMKKGNWQFEVLSAKTIPYPEIWKHRLEMAASLNAAEFMQLHNEYGKYTGEQVKSFIEGFPGKVDLIASHGHTIFHQPEKRFTFQIGSGLTIAQECNILTISDFRSMDIALGGQGAPLVPAGDRQLFSEYDFCLNLGGFANISNEEKGTRIACDLCPVNFIANRYASEFKMEFDRDGLLGRKGSVHQLLVDELNNLEFYSYKGPKSLGREWVEQVFLPVISKYDIPIPDLLRSFYEHAAIQIAAWINRYPAGKVLTTGGGAYNTFLIELIRQKSGSEIILPDDTIIKFKEALIFAFLGVLRLLGEVNCYASVTGASQDSSGGVIFEPY
ncbi:MAG TPA: anhydro-N-acetylmuramic acid kinase [Bacteroidales bacterium]|nr:anhydro-N-acetylmuramic acid kinase [Bacteroidales bacterium]